VFGGDSLIEFHVDSIDDPKATDEQVDTMHDNMVAAMREYLLS